MLVLLKSGVCLFYCEHKPCYFWFNLQFCFHGNYGTGERAQKLFLHGKKLEDLVFVQGTGAYSTVFLSCVSQLVLESRAQAPSCLREETSRENTRNCRKLYWQSKRQHDFFFLSFSIE